MSSSYRRGSRPDGRRQAVPALLALCLALGGCSLGVGPMADERVESTGSIRKASSSSPLSSDLGQEDWRRAKAALGVALDPQGSGAPVKWENPDTDVSGTITPVAQPFVQGDEVCRAFVASISFPDRTSQLQGTACRLSADEWRLGDVKPWRKPG